MLCKRLIPCLDVKDGRRLERRVDQAKGQPQNPLTEAELETKFRDCAARVLPLDRIEPILTAVRALETVADVGVVSRLLNPDRG